MGATTPDVDGDLPPSAKFVAHVLQKDGPLRLSELRETTGLSQRTVYNALDTLEEFYELGR